MWCHISQETYILSWPIFMAVFFQFFFSSLPMIAVTTKALEYCLYQNDWSYHHYSVIICNRWRICLIGCHFQIWLRHCSFWGQQLCRHLWLLGGWWRKLKIVGYPSGQYHRCVTIYKSDPSCTHYGTNYFCGQHFRRRLWCLNHWRPRLQLL